MKLKQTPDDFQVEELWEHTPGKLGAFACYQLTKSGLGTPEAVAAVCRHLKLDFRRCAFGGFKDRHASTRQFLTIHRGPRRGFAQTNLKLTYLGQLERAMRPSFITGNRFRIVLRSLSDSEVDAVQAAFAQSLEEGVANYFDDQRFGSVGEQGEFVARKLIDGEYEAALRLALTEPYAFDSKPERKVKATLRGHWGDWDTLATMLAFGPAREPVRRLARNPDGWTHAIAALPADLLSLYLAAYQSYLWNQLLSRWLQANIPSPRRFGVDLQLGRVWMPSGIDPAEIQALRSLVLPLPSARLHLEPNDPIKPLLDQVLEDEGLTLASIKLKHFRKPYFSKGHRPAVFVPTKASSQAEMDERHRQRRKLTLQFDLPRGCYATMLVKRVTRAEVGD